ncbi:MAG TPA: chorismate synthase [Kiritimatiellia bacterium]|nr:chorismate synthase [Kiritimatiellia bacterium]HPS08815.1 chorismate synthase [Kiritimatiellia bacterium]
MPLRYLTAGESHGPALTAIIEGMPAGLPVSEDLILVDLARRQTGKGSGDRMAIEKDRAQILAGVMEGVTTGAPIALQIANTDHANWKGKAVPAYTTPRPGHADLAAAVKYGYDDIRPSLERASARETAMRVAVGAVCRAFLKTFGISVGGYVSAIDGHVARLEGLSFQDRLTRACGSDVQCPDPDAAARIGESIENARASGETLGGVIEVFAQGVPAGLGSHVNWDRRLDARLAQAVLGVPAIKGVEIGNAFANTAKTGTHAQDAITLEGQGLDRKGHACGGIEGGISNGQDLWLRAAMKPIPTTRKGQETVDLATGKPALTYYERSDVCPVPRAVVVLEAVVAIVLADALIEKVGGDSLAEMRPRFEALRRATLDDVRMTGKPHVFWP